MYISRVCTSHHVECRVLSFFIYFHNFAWIIIIIIFFVGIPFLCALLKYKSHHVKFLGNHFLTATLYMIKNYNSSCCIVLLLLRQDLWHNCQFIWLVVFILFWICKSDCSLCFSLSRMMSLNFVHLVALLLKVWTIQFVYYPLLLIVNEGDPYNFLLSLSLFLEQSLPVLMF